MSEIWMELKDIPVGNIVNLKDLGHSVVRVVGKSKGSPRTHIAIDARMPCDDRPIIMNFSKNSLGRMLNREEIEELQLQPVEGIDLCTRETAKP